MTQTILSANPWRRQYSIADRIVCVTPVKRNTLLSIISAVFLCETIFAQQVPSPSPAARDSLTVVYWNIQWFPGRRPNANGREQARHIESVHRDLANIDADIVGLEEVRDFANAGVAVEPLRDFKVDVCSNFPPREGQNVAQQVAIASRLPAISAWAEPWKSGAAITPPRGFAFAAYQLAPNELLLVYALHLKSNRGGLRENITVREESIHQLLTHMQAMERAYGKLGRLHWIVGGDFNTAPGDQRFSSEKTTRDLLSHGFSWAWQNTPNKSRITLPPSRLYPAACFDHIFYRGATLQHARVINTSPQSSDHRAIEATLVLNPETSPD